MDCHFIGWSSQRWPYLCAVKHDACWVVCQTVLSIVGYVYSLVCDCTSSCIRRVNSSLWASTSERSVFMYRFSFISWCVFIYVILFLFFFFFFFFLLFICFFLSGFQNYVRWYYEWTWYQWTEGSPSKLAGVWFIVKAGCESVCVCVCVVVY